MKKLLLALVLLFGCGSMPVKPTVGQELCSTGCKILGGKYHDMSEQGRKCYCVFDMPEHINLGMPDSAQNGQNKSKEGLDI